MSLLLVSVDGENGGITNQFAKLGFGVRYMTTEKVGRERLSDAVHVFGDDSGVSVTIHFCLEQTAREELPTRVFRLKIPRSWLREKG